MREWLNFIMFLNENCMLGVFRHSIEIIAPRSISQIVVEWDNRRRKTVEMRAGLLATFAEEAARNDLHFIVIKGMALSAAVYGDYRARQSGDIDILVAADDIPKADYVARRCGWMQPGEARIARPLYNAGTLDRDTLENMQAPFSLRSNVILPHFTNYYFAYPEGGAESLEIHDRFHGIDEQTAANLLWNVSEVEVGGTEFLTCPDELALIISLLSLHEDAETLRANTSSRSAMGFKTCYDIHRQIQMFSRTGQLVNVPNLAGSLGVLPLVEIALSDEAEIFPQDAVAIDSCFTRRPSAWGMTYVDRVTNPERRGANGTELLGKLILNTGSRFCADHLVGRRGFLQSVSGSLTTAFEFEIRNQDDTAATATWIVPEQIESKLDRLVFQCVVIDDQSNLRIGWRVNTLLANGIWRASAQPIGPGTIDGHASRIIRRQETSCKTYEMPSGTAIAVTLPELSDSGRFRCYASVWERIYGQLHRRIAGVDFADVVDRAMIRAALFAGPYAEYLTELRETTLFKDMSDEEILSALEAMRPVICEGPLKPLADGSPHKAFRMVLRTDPPKTASPRQFAYDHQRRGEPGMLMGEVLVLSSKELYLKPTPLSVKPPLPPFEGSMLTLEFTPEMLEAPSLGYSENAMAKLRRNMMGMLAQKVVDVRRDLFLERSGFDVYADENKVSSEGGTA